MSNPVARLHDNIKRLHEVQHRRDAARKEKRQDAQELKGSQRALDHDRAALKKDRKEIGHERSHVEHLKDAEQDKLKPVDRQIAAVEKKLQDAGLTPEEVASLNEQLTGLQDKETRIRDRFDPEIAKSRAKIDRLHGQAESEKKAVSHDVVEKKKDQKALDRSKKALEKSMKQVKRAYARARKHLRPAEYKMNLKQTNAARRELGLDPVKHVIRPANLNTVKGCAQFLLHSKNVSYWTGLSSGSDIKNIRRLAHGKAAFVPATGGHVMPKLSMMQALVDMAKHGPIQINALTGGTHSTGSNHYSGTAVDLDINVGNTSEIVSIANRHGGARNSETSHIHLDF